MLLICVCVNQMIPLIKNSTDTLVEKFGEMAESGRSYELFRYTRSVSLASNTLCYQ